MRLLNEEKDAADRVLVAAEAALEGVASVISRHTSLSSLDAWVAAVGQKLDALRAAAETDADAPRLPPWSPASFARKLRAELYIGEETVVTLLAHFRPVESSTLELFACLSERKTEHRSLLRLVTMLMGDFISVESALYGRFPHLEPSERGSA